MTIDALHAVYAMAFGIALAATVALTWGLRARLIIKDTVILLLAVWLLTRVSQIVTGDFAPYPLNAAIDTVAAYVAYGMARERWQVLLVATFAIDMIIHCVMFAGGFSVYTYLTIIAVIAYAQLILVSLVAWHERIPDRHDSRFFDWLRGHFAWPRHLPRGEK
jgi:hypothetical protein